MGNNLTDDQKRAAFLREVDPQLQAWLSDLSRNGIDRSVRMGSPLNEAARVSSGYGRRNGDAIGHGEGTPPPTSVHEAIDFTSQRSSAGRNVMVNALVGGRVLWAGDPGHGSGQSVMIGGVDGRIYSIAHFRAGTFRVHAGQQIGRDSALAVMGQTGTASGDCAHVVVRELPLGGDFSNWSYANRTGFLGDHISSRTVTAALSQYRRGDADHRISWADFDRGEFVLGWPNPRQAPREQMAVGTRHAANDERDRYPHVYAMRERLTEYYQTHPWPHVMGPKPNLRGEALEAETRRALNEVMGLNPESTSASARLRTLDAQIYEFSRNTPANAEVTLRVGWMTPEMQSANRAYSESQSVTSRVVCTVSLGNAWCPPPPPRDSTRQR